MSELRNTSRTGLYAQYLLRRLAAAERERDLALCERDALKARMERLADLRVWCKETTNQGHAHYSTPPGSPLAS